MRIEKKYKEIFELAQKYYKGGREKDNIHHLRVAEMMREILEEVPLDEETMIAAALLHDIGYSKIPKHKRRKFWAKKVKKDHMFYGAQMAKKNFTKGQLSSQKD